MGGTSLNSLIKKAYENGFLVLFLGAGCSVTSTSSTDENLLSTEKLSQTMADLSGLNYNGESLSKVYSAARRNL
jgi:FAD/FMN-containing dehydrogenase